MAEIELKPCPFCGGKAVLRMASEILYNGEVGGWKATCQKCGIETAIENRKTAAEKWNRRADNAS